MGDIFSLRNIFQAGGFTMQVLAFCSILVVTVIIERGYVFRKFGKEFKRIKEGAATGKGMPILSALIINPPEDVDEAKRERIQAANITRIFSFLDKHLPVLATIGSMSPFIGLFGTVIGIIKAFRQLSIQRGAGIEVVGLGIAEALVCTAAGLFVAIISVICYNLFKTKAKRIIDQFDITYLSGEK